MSGEGGWTHIRNPGWEDHFHRSTGCESGSGKEENRTNPQHMVPESGGDDNLKRNWRATFHGTNESFRSMLAESTVAMPCLQPQDRHNPAPV